MKLYVDDIRRVPDDSWHLVKSNTEAIRLLATQKVEEISLDHDIACYLVTGQEHTSNETFQPIAYFIANMPKEFRPKTVRIHTANPVAGEMMASILKDKVETLIRDDLKRDFE